MNVQGSSSAQKRITSGSPPKSLTVSSGKDRPLTSVPLWVAALVVLTGLGVFLFGLVVVVSKIGDVASPSVTKMASEISQITDSLSSGSPEENVPNIPSQEISSTVTEQGAEFERPSADDPLSTQTFDTEAPSSLQGLLRVGDDTYIIKRADASLLGDARKMILRVMTVRPGEDDSASALRRNPSLELSFEFRSLNKRCSPQDLGRYAYKFFLPDTVRNKMDVVTLDRAPDQAVREILTLACSAQKAGGALKVFTAGSQPSMINGRRVILGWNVSVTRSLTTR